MALTLFLSLGLGLLAQDHGAARGPGDTLIEDPVEVPMLSWGGRPAAQVDLNAEHSLRLLIDTGTGFELILSPSCAERVGLDNGSMVEEIALGEARFFEVPSRTLDFGAGRDTTIDGILGLPFFAACTLELDFAKSLVRVSDRSLEEDGEGVVSIVEDPSMPGILCVEIVVAGHLLKAHLDTGSPDLAMFAEELKEELPLLGDPERMGVAKTPMGSATIWSATLDGTLQFGPLEFENPQIRFSGLPQIAGKRLGNLGCRAFAGCHLTIDARHRLLRVQVPAESKDAESDPAAPTRTHGDIEDALRRD